MKVTLITLFKGFILLIIGGSFLIGQDLEGDPSLSKKITRDSVENRNLSFKSVYLHSGFFYPNNSFGLGDGIQAGVSINVALSSQFQIEMAYRGWRVRDSNANDIDWSLVGASLMFDPFSELERVRPYFFAGAGFAWYQAANSRERTAYFNFGGGFHFRLSELLGFNIGVEGLSFSEIEPDGQLNFLTDFGLVFNL